MEVQYTIALAIINGLMGVIMWFMKSTINELKEQNKENRIEIVNIKDTYTKKHDFTEFKNELWLRLDAMKLDFQRALDKR